MSTTTANFYVSLIAAADLVVILTGLLNEWLKVRPNVFAPPKYNFSSLTSGFVCLFVGNWCEICVDVILHELKMKILERTHLKKKMPISPADTRTPKSI